jgi:hypothetical protein
VCLERLRRRQTLCIRSRQIDDQADDGRTGEVATSNAEPANFDQAGQFARRPDYNLSVGCVQMDTVIADQNGLGYLSGAPGKDEIERQPRLAGA